MADLLPRPLGLFLSGGGAFGAWQAGVLAGLDAGGLAYDEVMGFSIGALNGTSVAFGRVPEARRRWESIDGGILRWSPRFWPPSLYSASSLRDFLLETDDAAARRSLRCPLTVLSASPAQGRAIQARFEPGDGGRWDAPMAGHLASSCAVPLIFPPVTLDWRGRRRTLLDGGVPMPVPVDFEPLSRCASVLVVETAGAAHLSLGFLDPRLVLDGFARRACRAVVDQGVRSLRRLSRPPRVYRLAPSRRLDSHMLDFSARALRPRLPLGGEDARAFLKSPEDFRVF